MKKAEGISASADLETSQIVAELLADIELKGDSAVRRYNEKFDGWTGDLLLSPLDLKAAAGHLPSSIKDDLCFARDRIRDFAQRQRDAIQEFEVELAPGSSRVNA